MRHPYAKKVLNAFYKTDHCQIVTYYFFCVCLPIIIILTGGYDAISNKTSRCIG